MANLTSSHTIISTTFKSLAAFTIAFALTRLVCQQDTEFHRISYLQLAFWLVVEATFALIAASIASYRVVVLEYLKFHEAESQQDVYLVVAESRDLLGAIDAARITTPVPQTRDGSEP
jgi:hypothetical protein